MARHKWSENQIKQFPNIYNDFEDRVEDLFNGKKALTGDGVEEISIMSGEVVIFSEIWRCGGNEREKYVFKFEDIVTKTRDEMLEIHKVQEAQAKIDRARLVAERIVADKKQKEEEKIARAEAMEKYDRKEFKRLQRKYSK